jgi:hypothetical protein
MTKEIVPYERSLKLKQLGFDEPCITKYVETSRGFILELTNICTTLGQLPSIDAPLFQQAFRWFRENYRLSVLIQDWLDDYSGEIVEWTIGEDRIIYEITNRTDTYEEAELACLDKLIEIIETKKEK